jgi:membrane protein implicated in regulation of membrane protease activity
VLVPTVLAHLYALAGLVGSWGHYRSAAAGGLFVASLLVPFGMAQVSRTAGGRLPPAAAAGVVVAVFGISIAVPALLPPADRGTLAAWNWGTGAMTLLGLALFVPLVVSFCLGIAHGVLAYLVVTWAGLGAWTAHLVVFAAVVPPLAAAQYIRMHGVAVRRRERAASERAAVQARGRDLDDVRLGDLRRLGELRDRLEPLLAHVAQGGALPLDDERSRAARLLAEDLRDALAAQREALWLPERLGPVPLSVLSARAAASRLGDDDRAWLGALVDVLARHDGWRRARLVLDATRAGICAVLTASGPAASRAAADPLLRALCVRRPVRIDQEEDLIVIDVDLATPFGGMM